MAGLKRNEFRLVGSRNCIAPLNTSHVVLNNVSVARRSPELQIPVSLT